MTRPGNDQDNPASPDEVTERKRRLRRDMIERLAALAPAEAASQSLLMADLIARQPWFRRRGPLMTFLATPQEPDLTTVLEREIASGRTVTAPRMDWNACTIEPHRVADLDRDLVPARHGLREPGPDCPRVPVSELEVVLVPAVAFDHAGTRLGRGGGFYDRFLSRPDLRALRVGVVFDLQILDQVPRQAHDARMDLVLTPTRVIDVRPSASEL
ncbi:MAG: hypothetical protein GIKADHBN_02046 [Phycisphaerales bacterium]|nr:hypothetical protein [Phycisphaerales bacterium]